MVKPSLLVNTILYDFSTYLKILEFILVVEASEVQIVILTAEVSFEVRYSGGRRSHLRYGGTRESVRS